MLSICVYEAHSLKVSRPQAQAQAWKKDGLSSIGAESPATTVHDSLRMAATLPFCEALNKGIISGTFVDTKVILFSRRDSSGRVFGAKPLYASSHVLKSVPYFNDREPLPLSLTAPDY